MSRRHGLIGASKPYLYKEEDAEFYYRQTSGGVIMNNSPLVGSIDRIKGQTIAWNQYLKKGMSDGGITITNGNNGTIIFNGTTTSYYFKPFVTIFGNKNSALTNSPAGKYLLSVNVVKNTDNLNLQILALNNRILFVYNTSDFTKSYKAIGTCSDLSAAGSFGLSNFGEIGTVFNDVQIQVNLIYLTLIYGEGNEPSTPEEFEADYQRWFGKPLTYEPYDEGSLRNVQMEGIKSVGFNQWDEEWEIGNISSTDGQNTSIASRFRSKNYIPVLPSTAYYISVGTYVIAPRFYNSTKDYLGVLDKNGAAVNGTKVFVTPDNCKYFRFVVIDATTYNNDICINISDTNKNGTYKSYKSDTRNFDVTSITGKLNGEGESVVIFPDGMKGVNDVKDEIYIEDGVTKAVKRIGRVDLGSLDYTLNTTLTGVDRFKTEGLITTIKGVGNNITPNLLCSKFVTKDIISANSDFSTNIITQSIGANASVYIYCIPNSYSGAATFKTSMSGVYIDYELAEPQVYVLDTPLPVAYNCEADGTEQILPEEIGTGIAPIMDIKYKAGNVAENPWYGIKWSEDNGQMQRIASNMELHATLPIQSNMKRCMLLDNGSVYKYISDADPFLYEDGTSVKYDGTDGQVMVEVPAYWYTAYKETDENNITWNYLKLYPEGGGQMYSRKIYRGAFEMITDNSDNNVAKGCSVSMLDFASMGTTKDTTSFVASDMQYLSAATSYRNWNYANVEATDVKNSLGKPTTNRDRATFRGIAARRGAGFSQEYWDSYNSLIRLYVVEYCNFDIQASINNNLTVEGFRQGGLGAGVTNANSTRWNNFNGYNPFVPCGITVPLGNKSGAISYAFTNDNFDDVSITYSIPSYRGIENPFGHIHKFIDGFNRKGKVENDVTTEMIYVCDTVSKFAENDADGYVLQSDTAPRASGSFGGVDWDAKGTFWPKLGGRTMYSDYFYNSYANNTWYTLFGGGRAYSGSSAGLFFLSASSGSGLASASIGSRLLFTK